MTHSLNKIFGFLGLVYCLFCFLILPSVVFAGNVANISGGGASAPNLSTYNLLAPLPGLIGNSVNIQAGLGAYLNKMFTAGVAVASGLAVLMIVAGGIQYVSSDAIQGKSEGKGRIQDALIGLLLAFMSYILLNQINPDLLNNDIQLQNAKAQGATLSNGIASGGDRGGQNTAQTQNQISALNQDIMNLSAQLQDPNLTDAQKVAIQQQIAAENNQLEQVISGNSSGGSSDRIGAYTGPTWTKDQIGKGDPNAYLLEGQTIPGTQTYFSPGETTTDSGTAAHMSASGAPLVEAAPGVVGSAASVYYPLGTILEINGLTYKVTDYNFVKNSNGTYSPANNAVTVPNRVDIFTENNAKANGIGYDLGRYPIKVISVPH